MNCERLRSMHSSLMLSCLVFKIFNNADWMTRILITAKSDLKHELECECPTKKPMNSLYVLLLNWHKSKIKTRPRWNNHQRKKYFLPPYQTAFFGLKILIKPKDKSLVKAAKLWSKINISCCYTSNCKSMLYLLFYLMQKFFQNSYQLSF